MIRSCSASSILQQALGFLAGDPIDRDAGPHRDDLGDVLFGNVGLFLGVVVARPAARPDSMRILSFLLAIAQLGRQLEFLVGDGFLEFASGSTAARPMPP